MEEAARPLRIGGSIECWLWDVVEQAYEQATQH